MSAALLTVLICTHDRARLLARVIDSLNAARRPADGVELLVVANHCRDDTHALLRTRSDASGGRLPLRWLAEPTPGKSHALNRGLAEIETPVVAFVDDDHRVDPDCLQGICEAVRDHPQADLFCGRILPDWDGSEPAWVHDNGRYRIYPLPIPRFDLGSQARDVTGKAVPGGGNLFVRTAWFERVGPFATDRGPVGHDLGGAEDSDWVLRAFALGARLWYVPTVVQYHYVDHARLDTGYLMRKAYARTAAMVGLGVEPVHRGTVPAYVWRKLAGYALGAATALGADRRRFFLVRTAAAWGEMAGHRRLKRLAKAGAAEVAKRKEVQS